MVKALICDDSLLMRKKLKDSLIKCGLSEIIEATDGGIAVEMYKKNMPDIVFMDIVMPVKDGIQAVEEIKSFDKNAKVVMASSSGTKEHLKRAIKAGAYEFIQKPWDQGQITEIINKIMMDKE